MFNSRVARFGRHNVRALMRGSGGKRPSNDLEFAVLI